ncbi:MAG TPA: NUDIX hydrolase [Pyrinomonadaceae bacterium]
METVHQISAGGVAYRMIDRDAHIAVIRTSTEGRWQLPKGLIDPGETPEITALREVREEAGIDCEIVRPVGDIEYWFVAAYDGVKKRYHKKVHFFFMKYLNGSVDDHDDEVAEARWEPIASALDLLAFKSEKELVEKAKGLI